MNRLLNIMLFGGIFFTSLLFAQEKTKIVDEKTTKGKPNSTVSNGDQVLFKNGSGNSILTVTDEGDNAGSITLPSLSSIGASSNKLYNIGGSLYWNGSALGTIGSAGGWTKNGTNVYLSNLTDFVGIGTSSPSNNLEIRTSTVSSAARLNLGNSDDSHHLFLYSGKEGNPNPMISWQEGDDLRFTRFDGTNTTENLRITSGGTVGIGTTTPTGAYLCVGPSSSRGTGIKVENTNINGIGIWSSGKDYAGYFLSEGTQGRGVFSYATGSGINYGGYFKTISLSGFGIGAFAPNRAVYGEASSTSGGANYGGYFSAAGENGRGVHGEATNTGSVYNYGGYFISNGLNGSGIYASGVNRGIYAESSNTSLILNYGGYFSAAGGYGEGVHGETTGIYGRGVYGLASNTGNGTNYGGYFKAEGSSGRGVYGEAQHFGGYFEATGTDGYTYGVHGHAGSSEDGNNVGGSFTAFGIYGRGVSGYASSSGDAHNYGGHFVVNGTYGRGIYSSAPSTGYAGYFDGRVYISGPLEKPAGSFKIDHPIDPTNKNLYHSFVESPDMMNIYNGNVFTDVNGNANIQLPEWFEALNKDFRYQLTVIGEFAQVIVSKKINNNRFSVKTDKPNVEVSWQVTGIRHDAYANANRIKVEEMKPGKDRGKYLQPEAFNMPKTMGVDYDERLEKERTRIKEEHKRIELERIKMDEQRQIEEQRMIEEKQRTENERQNTEGQRKQLVQKGR